MTVIHLSPTAIKEVKRIQSKHPDPDSFFRLGVKAGGCFELYYTLEIDQITTATDHLFHVGEIRVVVDTESLQYLNGINIDYTEDLMGGGFRFSNPNASNSCGCGNSFSIAPA